MHVEQEPLEERKINKRPSASVTVTVTVSVSVTPTCFAFLLTESVVRAYSHNFFAPFFTRLRDQLGPGGKDFRVVLLKFQVNSRSK